jgi:WD40 repeat protein
VNGREWLSAEPYVRRHAADHAARGGVLGELVTDVGYLAVADPERLLGALDTVETGDALAIVEVYRRVAGRLAGADPLERMAMLHLVALQERGDAAERLRPLLEPRWQARWVQWRRTLPSIVVAELGEHATAVTVAGDVLVVAVGSRLRSWSLDTLDELPAAGDAGGTVTALAAAPGGVVAGFEDGGLCLLGLPGLEAVSPPRRAHEQRVLDLAVVDDLVASACHDGSLALWSLPQLERVRYRDKATPVQTERVVVATRHGERVLVTAGDGYAQGGLSEPGASAWSIPDLERLASPGPESFVTSVLAVGLGGSSTIVTCCDLRLWDLDTGEVVEARGPGARSPVRDGIVLESDDDHAVVLAHSGGALRLLQIERRDGRLALTAGPFVEAEYGLWRGPVRHRGRRYAVSVGDAVRLWDVDRVRAAIAEAPESNDAMLDVQRESAVAAVDASGDSVWIGSSRGDLQLVSLLDGSRLRAVEHLGNTVIGLAAGDDPLVIGGSEDGRLWMVRPGEAPVMIEAGDHLYDVARSGDLVATSGRRGDRHEVRLWRLPDGEPVRRARVWDDDDPYGVTLLGWEDKPLGAVTFLDTPDGPVVVAGGRGGVGAWDSTELEPVWEFSPERRPITSLAAAHGVLAAGDEHGGLRVWRLDDRRSVLSRSDAYVRDVVVAFVAPAGEPLLASGSWDGVLRLWSLDDWGQRLAIPLAEPIFALAPAAGGRDLLVGTRRGIIALQFAA